MAESPKKAAELSQTDLPTPAKPLRSPGVASAETARAADSIPAPGGPFTALPMQFGRYQIRKELGRGQMGAVYLAHDTELDRLVALKVARVSSSGSAKLLKRMEIEAKSAARVEHPLICKVHDAGEIDGIRFIALQYIEGEDLKQFMKRTGRRRNPDEAVRLVLQILGALAAAHEKGVIHRDLKPENVMLNKKREPVIMDFGLARTTIGSSNAGLTQGMIVGTAAYMSPEQATGKAEAIDHRSDLYAVGVMLFEMLTGEWPFTGGAIEVMGKKCVQEPASPLSLNQKLNPQLAAVCHKMIAKQRADRYTTCAEVIEALEAIASNAPSSMPSPALVLPPPPVNPSMPFDFASEFAAAPISRLSATGRDKKDLRRKQSASVFSRVMNWWNNQSPIMQWMSVGGVAAGLFLLATVLYFRNADAVVKVEIHAEDVDVTFQNKTITFADGSREFKVSPGSQTLHVKHGDVEFDTDRFTLKQGRNAVVTVEIVKSDLVTRLGDHEFGRRSLTVSSTGKPGSTSRSDLSKEKGRVTANESNSSTSNSKIPAGTVTFHRKRFKIFPEPLTWHDARKRCQQMGGRLAEVRSKEENDVITNMAVDLNVEGVWLGATDELQEGRWLWSDGSEVTYENWSPVGQQPNNGGKAANEHYLLLWNRIEPGEWFDHPDNGKDGIMTFYVCEWDAPTVAQIDDGNWRPLFNGKDLAGWSVDGGQARQWSVEGADIVGRSESWRTRNYLLSVVINARPLSMKRSLWMPHLIAEITARLFLVFSGLQAKSGFKSTREHSGSAKSRLRNCLRPVWANTRLVDLRSPQNPCAKCSSARQRGRQGIWHRG